MGRKVLTKKAPKLVFETAKPKQEQKGYMVNDDAIKRMRNQLANIGCKLLEVEADGNCLFRALSDQLYGNQHQHEEVRMKIVNYIQQHRDDFEPFMEDEEKFEKYCKRMREDGTWGGNQELYAAARLFQVYLIVHQDQPRARIMVIECDHLQPTQFVHVAYHGDDHYDSVRSLKDSVELDSVPIPIDLECDGFRMNDFTERWHTHTSTMESTSNEQLKLCVVPKPAMDTADGRVDRVASRLSDQLQLAAGTVSGAGGQPRSKKELRKLRKTDKSPSVPS